MRAPLEAAFCGDGVVAGGDHGQMFVDWPLETGVNGEWTYVPLGTLVGTDAVRAFRRVFVIVRVSMLI